MLLTPLWYVFLFNQTYLIFRVVWIQLLTVIVQICLSTRSCVPSENNSMNIFIFDLKDSYYLHGLVEDFSIKKKVANMICYSACQWSDAALGSNPSGDSYPGNGYPC